MALNRQKVSIDFGQGIDTKTHPHLVVRGKFKRLVNAVQRKTGSISKRYGNSVFSKSTTTGGEIPDGEALATFNNELLLFGAQSVYAYSENADQWVDKGSAVSTVLTSKQIIRNTANQTIVDSAITNGVGLYAWEDSRGGVRATLIDETTGTPILTDVSIDSSGSRPRCLSLGSYLFLFYYKSGSLYCSRIAPLDADAFESAVELSTTVNTTNPTYDVTVLDDNTMLFAHNVQGANEIKLARVLDTPVVDPDVTAVTISEAGTDAICLVVGYQSRIFLAYYNSTNDLRCTVRNNGLAELVAPTDIETVGATVENITGYPQRDDSGIQFFYQVTASATYDRYIRKNTFSNSGTAGTASDLVRSVGLASKAFVYYGSNDTTDRGFVVCVHESTLQATYFVIRNDGLVVAKSQPSTAGTLTTRPILSNVENTSTGFFSLALINKGRLVSENNTLFTLKGVMRLQIDFTSDNAFQSRQLGKNLHIAGGVLSMYDGQSVVEHGFHLYPEYVSLASSNGSGSLNNNGVYQVIAVYEWTDAQGQLHRSAPSVAESITLGASDDTITVTVGTLRLTEKTSPRSEVSIAIYATEDAGSTFYRQTSVTSPSLNDPTADTVDIDLLVADSALISNEILYTTGGILNNSGPPACSGIEVYKKRLLLTGCENPNEFWYSHKAERTDLGVEFAAELTGNIDPEGGDIQAPGVLDDKILFFKEDRPHLMFGDGPNRIGQGQFSEPERVSIDVGTNQLDSLGRTADGLIFKSQKGGIYEITRSLQPNYIGAPVEDWNDETITSSVLKSSENQVRLTTREGPCLVYDYLHGQWYTFENFKAEDAVMWKGDYTLLRANGDVVKEDPTRFKDSNTAINVVAETGWMSFDGINGFQRLYQFAILGEYKSPHSLRVKVAYDFSDTYQTTYIFAPDTDIPISKFGDDAVFGVSDYFGGPSGSYQFRADFEVQKCSSVKFLIEELTTTATTGTQEGFTISALTVLVGTKGSINRLPESKTLASS